MKILFINHSAQNCGVADYGRRLYTILKDHLDISYCDWEPDFTGYEIALYNYHYATMPNIRLHTCTRNIALFHEAFMLTQFDQVINVSDLPRPLLPIERYGCVKPSIIPPVIGSFGFGFPDKNFPGIASMVKREFKVAALRLNIPFAEFGDKDGTLAKAEAAKCAEILSGTGIKLEVYHNFIEPASMVQWLAINDINVFNHTGSQGRGISSSIDYALSANRAIAVSNSEMYRHLPRSICLDNISLSRLIEQGTEPLKEVYEANSNERLIEAIKNLIQ